MWIKMNPHYGNFLSILTKTSLLLKIHSKCTSYALVWRIYEYILYWYNFLQINRKCNESVALKIAIKIKINMIFF